MLCVCENSSTKISVYMRIAGGQNIFVPILQVYNDVTERKKDIMKYRKALTFSYDDGIEQDRKLV